MLTHYLRGSAKTYHWSLPKELKSSYKSSLAALDKRYGCHRKQKQFRTVLNERKRIGRESVSDLADDIRALSVKVYSTMDHMARDELEVQAFKQAVDKDLRIRFLDRNRSDTDEAVAVTEEWTTTPSIIITGIDDASHRPNKQKMLQLW